MNKVRFSSPQNSLVSSKVYEKEWESESNSEEMKVNLNNSFNSNNSRLSGNRFISNFESPSNVSIKKRINTWEHETN